MAYTSPKTYSVGDVLTASDMNTYQRDNILHVYNKFPVATADIGDDQVTWAKRAPKEKVRVYMTSGQSTSAGALVVVTFDAENFDTDDMWNSGESGRITFNTAGYYLVGGETLWYAASTDGNYRIGAIRLNGTDIITLSGFGASNAGNNIPTPGTLYYFDVDDYIQLLAQSQETDTLEAASLWAIRLD